MAVVNRHTIRVAWGDCDPAGIVFYPNFYRWMDISFWLLFESQKLSLEVLKRRFRAFGGPLVDSGATFQSPASAGDILTVTSQIERWSEKSFYVDHEFTQGDTKIASGFEKRVWGTRQDDGSIRANNIPDEVKTCFI